MDALRVEVERIAGARALGGLPSNRLAAGSVSDLVQVNRVQGLTLGFGGTCRPRASGSAPAARSPMAPSDERVTGGLALRGRDAAPPS